MIHLSSQYSLQLNTPESCWNNQYNDDDSSSTFSSSNDSISSTNDEITYIQSLPIELLQSCLAECSSLKEISRCSKTCKIWQQAIKSSPEIWENISLPTFRGSEEEVFQNLQQLSLLSGNHVQSLSISLNGQSQKALSDWISIIPLQHLRSLKLTSKSASADQLLFNLAMQFPRLQSLEIISYAASSLHLFTANAVCRPKIFIKTFGSQLSFDDNLLNFLSNAEKIVLPDHSMPVKFFTKLMERIHDQVKELELILQKDSDHEESLEPINSFYCPRLKSLSLHWSGSGNAAIQSPILQAPNIDSVELTTPEADDHRQLIEILPNAKRLRLCLRRSTTAAIFESQLLKMQNLQKLILLCRSDTSVINIVQALQAKPYSLPTLQQLAIDNDDDIKGSELVDMIAARKIYSPNQALEELRICDCFNVDNVTALTLMSIVPSFIRHAYATDSF